MSEIHKIQMSEKEYEKVVNKNEQREYGQAIKSNIESLQQKEDQKKLMKKCNSISYAHELEQ